MVSQNRRHFSTEDREGALAAGNRNTFELRQAESYTLTLTLALTVSL